MSSYISAPSLLQVHARESSAEVTAEEPEEPEPEPGLVYSSHLEETDNSTMNVTVIVRTSDDESAGTASGATIAFKLGDNYTEDVPLVENTSAGSIVTWKAKLSSWPSMVRITGTDDSWSVKSIELQGDGKNATLVNGSEGSSISATTPMELTVPAQIDPVQCVTRFDPRIEANFYQTAENGTACIFGLDDRDEGTHCVYDEGLYGSYGWCYTDESRSTWGSCSEGCPLQGNDNIIGKKIDQVMDKIDDYGKNFDTIIDLVNSTTSAPEAAEEAPKADGPANSTTSAPANSTTSAPEAADEAPKAGKGSKTGPDAGSWKGPGPGPGPPDHTMDSRTMHLNHGLQGE
jgi:hypothetical protein